MIRERRGSFSESVPLDRIPTRSNALFQIDRKFCFLLGIFVRSSETVVFDLMSFFQSSETVVFHVMSFFRSSGKQN